MPQLDQPIALRKKHLQHLMSSDGTLELNMYLCAEKTDGQRFIVLTWQWPEEITETKVSDILILPDL